MQQKINVMLVFGTRPEAIKMAPLVHQLRANSEEFTVRVCVTAQHRQMLDQVLSIFDIVPDFDLEVMTQGQSLSDVTVRVLSGMQAILESNKPDIVLVHGDTTTTLAASMACFYAGVPIGHVEAGLRTNDIYAPFPEEFNRQVTSKITHLHFAPTNLSRDNLVAEGVNPDSVFVTGNTVIDSLQWVLKRMDCDGERRTNVERKLSKALPFDWRKDKFVLVTGHRRENFGEGFLQICEALRELATRFEDVHFVYPAHLNPQVQKPVQEVLSGLKNVNLVDPLDYEPFVTLLRHSHIVLTDSGGIQEEAPSLGKPVLVMRDVTERPEAVAAGTVELVGAKKSRIVESVSNLLANDDHHNSMARAHNPYGNGQACKIIVDVLRDRYQTKK